MNRRHCRLSVLLIGLCLVPCGAAVVADEKDAADSVPDLTRTIDFERKGEYHLGPTGAKGWIYTGRDFMTTDARQILITKVEPGTPADGVLEAGDVILGIGSKEYFSGDARKSLGRAIDAAEAKHGVLRLIRWRPTPNVTPRQGTETTVALQLEVMGEYSITAPWDCPKTERVLEKALEVLVERKEMGRLSDVALALLATGEKEHQEIVREYLHAAKWARPDFKVSVESGGLQCWWVGYRGLLLTEYFLATGDEYVLPAIREYSVKTAMGQSAGGTWGHGFAWTSKNDGKLHGRLGGYGALNQAGLPCLLSLILAKKCGVEHPEIDTAISRATRFFEQFIGKGSIGYGYHRPSLEIHANGRNGMSGNGKNGIAAIAFRVLGHREGQRFFARLTASLYNTCEYGHSGNSYSYYWDPLGASCGGPMLVAEFLKKLRWYHALTRQADGSFAYQKLGGHYGSGLLDPTAAQVLIATLPRKAIYLTGKGQEVSEWIGAKDPFETLAAGKWRSADPDKLSVDAFFGALDSWSPIAREWAAKKLATKRGDFVPRLLRLLESDRAEARAGACAALGYLGDRAADAVPHLSEALADEESIVTISAGYALARIGKPAQQAVPDVLRAILASKETEPMRPRQQALAYALGYAAGKYAPLYFDGILAQAPEGQNPLAGLDRERLLYPTIRQLLEDSSGRTRGCGAYAWTFFSREDAAAMAQEIYDAIATSSANYRMFSDDPRQAGLELLARLDIEEGLPLCLATFDLKEWGQSTRVPGRFKVLQTYRGNAKPFLSRLREMRSIWKSGEHRDGLEQTIRIIEEDNDPRPLVSLHDLVDERLDRDLASARDDRQRVELCRRLTRQRQEDGFYRAAGLRKLVAIRGAGAFDDLLGATAHPNAILHETVVALAAGLPGAEQTDKWVDQLADADGRRLAGILDVLGRRGDRRVLPAVKKYLEHGDPVVLAAAIRAVADIESR